MVASAGREQPQRLRVLAAAFYEDEAEHYSTPSGIHPLDVHLVGVYTGARDGAVTVTLNRSVGDPYGVEFHVTSLSARQLAKKLMAAAMAVDTGAKDDEF